MNTITKIGLGTRVQLGGRSDDPTTGRIGRVVEENVDKIRFRVLWTHERNGNPIVWGLRSQRQDISNWVHRGVLSPYFQ